LIGVGVSLAFIALIVYSQLQPLPAPRAGLVTPYSDGATLHVPPEAPCTVERMQAACDRWSDHGWPRCVAQASDGSILVVVYDGEERGAHAEGRIGLRPDACGDRDPTPEHELGHALDLAHTGRTGSIMASSHERVGFTFPEAPEAP